MKCIKPIKVNGQYFNCGSCHACRINYTTMWSLRCLYELEHWNSASFITLTYDDLHLPKDLSLNPKDLTDFWKRLRSRLDTPIKYRACGEYGDRTMRPHYHAIVYGLDCYNDEHRRILADCWSFCEPWFFDKNRGRSSAMQNVTREDIQYVNGYIQKKLTGEMGKEKYGDKIRPFSRTSQGLGLNFAMTVKNRLINNGYTWFNAKKVSIPRYYCEKFGYKKSELLNIGSNISIEKLQKENNYLYEQFIRDMKKNNTYYPDNLSMMSIRFEHWYQDREFEYAKQIEKDFIKRSKMNAKL